MVIGGHRWSSEGFLEHSVDVSTIAAQALTLPQLGMFSMRDGGRLVPGASAWAGVEFFGSASPRAHEGERERRVSLNSGPQIVHIPVDV